LAATLRTLATASFVGSRTALTALLAGRGLFILTLLPLACPRRELGLVVWLGLGQGDRSSVLRLER
jgi:hypothetical protein